jgi:hypothetical protein
MSWTMFYRQLDGVAEHTNWTARVKVSCLLAVLQGQAINVLRSVGTEEAYEHSNKWTGLPARQPAA